MCGRTSLFLDADDMAYQFGATAVTEEYVPRYNIARGQSLEVLYQEAQKQQSRPFLFKQVNGAGEWLVALCGNEWGILIH